MASGGFSLPHPSVGLASSSSSSSVSPLRGSVVSRRAACRPQGCRRGGRRQLAAPRVAAGSGALPAGPLPGCGDTGRRLVRGRHRGAGAPVPAASASRNSPSLGRRAGSALVCPARLPRRSALHFVSPARCWRLRTINSRLAGRRATHARTGGKCRAGRPAGRARSCQQVTAARGRQGGRAAGAHSAGEGFVSLFPR